MWWILACAPKTPSVAPDVLPVLPPPREHSYAHVVAIPRDPLVAQVMGGRPWEASLAGAAAGVALRLTDGEEVGPRTVAWRAVLAGYPWPVDVAEKAWSEPGRPPEALSAQARALAADPGRDVGLVRARGKGGEVWVLLSARRKLELPVIPREVRRGASLPALGVEARIFSPAGGAARPLPTVLDDVGEWMLEVYDDAGVAARLPIQVEGRAEEAPPLADGAASGDPVLLAEELVAGVRARYDEADWRDDAMLASVARALLRQGEVDDLEATVRAAGFAETDVAGAVCTAPDVPSCLDRIWWSGPDRSVLVGAWPHLAIAGERGGEGVRLVLLGAG